MRMPKTIFHTTEKSNFVLNMDLDKYRAFCVKLLTAMLCFIGFAEMIFQLTYSSTVNFNQMVAEGGMGAFLALIAVGLRSVAVFFSTFGVFVVIAMIVGMMRKQFAKSTAIPYLLVLAMLLWAVGSLLHSYDIRDSLFGQDGRDEGWFALLIYGAVFYVASMLRREKNIRLLLNLTMGFGLVQCLWGFVQSLPIPFPNEYSFVGPLLFENLHLPSGLTDSPITYAMLLSMLLCIAIPAVICGKEKKQRTFALVCAAFDMLMLFKTQTIAGLLGACFGILLAVILSIVCRKKSAGKAWLMPLVLAGALAVSGVWVFFTPTINGAYRTYNDAPLPNGFAFYDGGIVWDDGFYRLSTACPYSAHVEHDFEIEDASSVLTYAWSEGTRVIAKDPVWGTGPDNFWYEQLRTSMALNGNSNGVDRPYNDFLFIAATRGVPSLVLYVVLLLLCLIQGIRNRKQTGSWVYLSAVFAVLAFTLTSMVGISVLTVSPLHWMMLGVLVGVPILEDAPKPVPVKAAADTKQSAENGKKQKNAKNQPKGKNKKK